MVKQYPYLLQKLVLSTSAQSDDGDFEAIEGSWCNVCKCRDEDTRPKPFQSVDGQTVSASHLIQCPFGVAVLESGTQIRVIDGTQVRLSGQVIYSSKKQLHTQVWV